MIRVLHSGDTINLNKYRGMLWVYIGSHKSISKLEHILEGGNRRFIGKDIADIIETVRDNYIDYIGILFGLQDDKAIWCASRMASKSLGQTTMFHQYVYLKLLERISQQETKDIVFITEDHELLSNIKKINCSRVEILSSKVFSTQHLIDKIKDRLKILRYFILWCSFRLFNKQKIEKFDIFIHSWISKKVFSILPQYYDSHFGALEKFLKEKKYRLARLAPLVVSLRNAFRLNKHFDNIVYPFSYVSVKDFFKAVFTKFSITHASDEDVKTIRDIKMLRILTENEVAKERGSPYFINYLLSFCAYRKMSYKIRYSASFIYPFENQPWEKVFNLAFAKFKRIAYQHSTIGSNLLDYRISKYESSALPLPNVILTVGERWAVFLKKYYDNINIDEAGAIRFEYLFQDGRKGSFNLHTKNIMVILPLNPAISVALQKILLKALENGLLKEYSIKIKQHPYLSGSNSLKSSFSVFKNCSFVKDEVSNLLAHCELLITSSSTVVFESVAKGIKTLYFIPEDVSLGHEYFVKDYLFIAYEEDFSDKLEDALRSRRYPDLNMKEYFSPPDLGIFLEHLEGKLKEEVHV